MWTASCNEDGYGHFWDGTNRPSGRRRIIKAHQYAWIRKHGPVPPGKQVLHKCDNPPCVNDAHLFLGTQLENIKDRVQKGRSWRPRGQLGGNSKLTQIQVDEIRKLYAAGGVTLKALALQFGVGKSSIGYIVNGTTWRTPVAWNTEKGSICSPSL